MRSKKFWIGLWVLIFLATLIISLVNSRPYLFMGGSSSVAPVMEELMSLYPDNHKQVDFNYISSASSGAPPRTADGLFATGWLSEEYTTPDPNMFTFQLMQDGLIIVYNMPSSNLVNPAVPLDFTVEKMKEIYLEGKSWKTVFPAELINDMTPKPYTRANGSGTRDVFDKRCLDGETFYKANTVESSSAMLNLDAGGIGYGSFSDLQQANPGTLKVKAGTWIGVEATFDNIKTKTYDLWRPFTGLINRNYRYQRPLADMFKWVYSSETDAVFAKFGPRVELTDPVNTDLKNWLDSFS